MTGRGQLAVVVAALAVGVAGLTAGRQLLRREIAPLGVGSKAPAFTAMTLDSPPRPKSLDAYRGQVVLINIWATWCLPCRVEMPSIEELHRTYAPRGLKVVAVSIDDPGTDNAIRSFVSQYQLSFEILHDPDKKISDLYQTSGYPETVIIGRDGIIRRKVLGASDWNSSQSRGLIERLLDEKVE
ncbi:MAG TPA: TlpA disulfide reductase family protein [Gemmatimonadaceae bacterium]